MNKYQDYYGEPKALETTWNTALYIRLSKEDYGNKDESISITNQREILLSYISEHPELKLVDIYIDDGFTGTDFDRPDFMRLKADIENGRVNCVVVKDLNRFGRNYTVGGDLIDNYFARKNVRFVSLNNCVDTTDDNMNDAARCINIGITNVINESYSAMTSVSIRGTLNNHRRQGKFIGAFACYGYKKDTEDYHKLVIDEKASPVVQMIYREFIGGRSILGIVKKLNDMGIPNPTLYKKQNGMNFNSRADNDGLWSDRTVRRILKNQMYIGNMVQGVNRTVSYKIHECRAVPKEEWIIVENTHEPIVEREVFEKAQSLFGRNVRCRKSDGKADLFAGFVFCADCGKAMRKNVKKQNNKVYRYYKCPTKQKSSRCKNHTIRIEKLEEAVLKYIQLMIDVAIEFDEVVSKVKKNAKRNEDNHIKNALSLQQKEREKCLKISADLYPDWKNNIITQEEYLRIKANIQEKLATIDSMIEKLRAQLQTKDSVKHNSFIEHFMKYRNIDRLTRPMLVELIDKILIHENGNITIKVKFADEFESAFDYLEQNKSIA